MLNHFLLTALSKAINTYLLLDPHSQQRFKKLHGKCFALELLPFQFVFYCVLTEQGIAIQTTCSQLPEVTIKGTPFQLLAIKLEKQHRQRFFAEDVSIEGNTELAQQIMELFDHLEVDWEALMASCIGDTPAFQLNRFSQSFRQWARQATTSVMQDIKEYLQEESESIPNKEKLQDFYHDVDKLRMDIDRLAARIRYWQTRNQDDETQ